MFCRDPYLETLRAFGYNVVRLPKADITPLQLLTKHERDFTRLGDLTDILVARESASAESASAESASEKASLPKIVENTQVADISGKRTGDLSLGLGLSILGTIIAALGGSKLGLDTQYEQARSISFEFDDVLQDSVQITDLDQYLGGADINPLSVHVGNLLLADQVFTTTAVIKSKKYTVEAKKSRKASLELNVPVIQEIVGADVKVSGAAETTSKISFEGGTPLVFGFQAVQIFYQNGAYTALEPADYGALRGLENVEDDGTQRLMTANPLVRLDDV